MIRRQIFHAVAAIAFTVGATQTNGSSTPSGERLPTGPPAEAMAPAAGLWLGTTDDEAVLCQYVRSGWACAFRDPFDDSPGPLVVDPEPRDGWIEECPPVDLVAELPPQEIFELSIGWSSPHP